MLSIGVLEAPIGSPPLLHFANFEKNARPSTNIEDYRTPCRTHVAIPIDEDGPDVCRTTLEARAYINPAIDDFIAVDAAVDAVAEAWR
jgi:hypothetical protein